MFFVTSIFKSVEFLLDFDWQRVWRAVIVVGLHNPVVGLAVLISVASFFGCRAIVGNQLVVRGFNWSDVSAVYLPAIFGRSTTARLQCEVVVVVVMPKEPKEAKDARGERGAGVGGRRMLPHKAVSVTLTQPAKASRRRFGMLRASASMHASSIVPTPDTSTLVRLGLP